MATLYHWDLPQPLEDAGGWLERDTALRFGEYAAIVAERLGDRVAQWCPVNEPNVTTLLGYAQEELAPARGLLFGALPVAHHLLLGHGLAVQALRAATDGQVGTATNHITVWPTTDSEADQAAAGLVDTLWNRLFADPILLGRYPEPFGDAMPGPVAADLELISAAARLLRRQLLQPDRGARRRRRRGAAVRVQRDHRVPDDRLRLARRSPRR